MTEKMSGEHQQIYESIEAVRSEHGDITESVNTVGSRMDKLERDLEVHMAEGHELYVQRTEIEAMFADFIQTVKDWLEESRRDRMKLHSKVDSVKEGHERVEEAQNVLANVVLGEPHLDIDGQIQRRGGMAEIVEDYTHGHKGFKVQLPWFRIVVALIGAVGTIVAAIIVASPAGVP